MKTVYRCEMCGREFLDDWRVCADHEATHPKIKSTQTIFVIQDDAVPGIIIAYFDNGYSARYEIKGEAVQTEKEKPAQAD